MSALLKAVSSRQQNEKEKYKGQSIIHTVSKFTTASKQNLLHTNVSQRGINASRARRTGTHPPLVEEVRVAEGGKWVAAAAFRGG